MWKRLITLLFRVIEEAPITKKPPTRNRVIHDGSVRITEQGAVRIL